MTTTATILPGFFDVVGHSQQSYRAVLDAMARPGSIRTLVRPEAAPEGWQPAMAALALTLLDQDTPVWRDMAAGTEEAGAYLRFHCGCPIADAPEKAAFAIVADAAGMPPLHRFSIGDPLYPELSATVLLSIESLRGGAPLQIKGPGIREAATIAPKGLPDGFIRQWADNHSLYPSGLDLILVSGDEVMAWPRGVSVEEA